MHSQRPAFNWPRLAAAVALAGISGAASAEGPQDSLWAQLAYFLPTIDSTARLDSTITARPGTGVRLEDELGLSDRKGTPYLLLGTRLGDRWRLEFEYYELKRSATTVLGRDIEWGDTTFPLSAEVTSRFDTSVYRLSGGYSFYRTQQAEAGAALGLHVTDFRLGLSGQGTGPAGLAFQREERDQLVPLPTVGLYGTYRISEQWQVRGRIDFLSFEYDEYDGSLTNWLAAIDWRFARNWGAGAGYRYVEYELDSTKGNFLGQVNYRFRGPTIYLEAAF
jgi:hypothetical protein